MANRLAHATSPYLLQHADNPVEWWEWSDAAFAEARRRDVPVLLSVGYAACHWCHVMAHESFDDAGTAQLMNAGFVCIKVDREERPDVDAVYMEATQAMTGHGGWPMTVFMTADGAPFYCGTYFPREHFGRLLQGITQAWQEDRAGVIAQGQQVVNALAERGGALPPGPPIDADLLDTAVDVLASSFDSVRGGFGDAPKFPPSMCLEFLLRAHARGNPRALAMAETTLEAMARGGMYDQLAGGFARYSVDADWVVPHFEKMLYDNALLLRVYAHWWRATGSLLAERVVRETASWMLEELRTPERGFASALDADSLDAAGHLEEGAYYVWTPDDVGPWVASLCAVTTEGTFEKGTSTLQLRRDPDDWARWAQEKERLLRVRRTRPAPARDDKVVTGWNGLAISALADAGVLLQEERWIEAARETATLLLDLHLVDGRLRRASRNGLVGAPAGVLEDYGSLADGLLALHQATGERRWLDAAGGLLDTALVRFCAEDGGFFDTADDAERLVQRPRDATDGATPAGASITAGALLTFAALTTSTAHRERADAALRSLAALLPRHARFAGQSAAVAEAALAGPLEIAVVGAPQLAVLARRSCSPGAVVVTGGDSPLLDGRPPGAAYVCRGSVCEAPTTDPARFAEQILVLHP
ncbi:MAG: uncharacterized protein QOK42_2339 [Frankiaceae bacterium]|nr:uncharacterized protein [Frankiaceae bacterium]